MSIKMICATFGVAALFHATTGVHANVLLNPSMDVPPNVGDNVAEWSDDLFGGCCFDHNAIFRPEAIGFSGLDRSSTFAFADQANEVTGLWQDTGILYQAGDTWTFSIWMSDGQDVNEAAIVDIGFGVIADGANPGDPRRLELIAGGSLTAVNLGQFVGSWARYEVTYAVDAADFSPGETIAVGVNFNDASPGGDYWFDQAVLIPSPGAVGLLALSGVVAVRRRQR